MRFSLHLKHLKQIVLTTRVVCMNASFYRATTIHFHQPHHLQLILLSNQVEIPPSDEDALQASQLNNQASLLHCLPRPLNDAFSRLQALSDK